MENNDSNIKPQQTGGLKILTVFIVVLGLHVVAIGLISAYYLLKGSNPDADVTTTDNTHSDLKGADSASVANSVTPDASQSDKSVSSAPAPTPPTEVATIPQTAPSPANPPTPAPDQVTTTEVTAPASVSAPTPVPATLTPTPTPSPTDVVDQGTPLGPISPTLAPPPEPALAPAPITPAPAPSTEMASGPVHMPPATVSAPIHQQIYTVKITDSYKKIAHTHHITVAQLKEANHISGNVLHTGQKLVIPSAKTLVAENAATPAPATALDSTSSEPISGESIAPMTANLASSAPAAPAPALHHHLYTVVKGDTLIKIAHKFKTTPSALMTENGISDPTKLAIGKKLKIPSEESRSARNGSPASTPPGQAQSKENAPTGQLANFVP